MTFLPGDVVRSAATGVWTHPAIGCLRNGEPVLDSEIRRALAALQNRFSETKEV